MTERIKCDIEEVELHEFLWLDGMLLDVKTWIMSLGALLAVLGLIVLLARLAKLSGFAAGGPSGRRLSVRESISIGGSRRLVIARCDEKDVLLLVGGGTDQVVGWTVENKS